MPQGMGVLNYWLGPKHGLTLQVAAGLIALGAMGGGATTAAVLKMRRYVSDAAMSRTAAAPQHRPSLAEQIALTSGYRAILN